MTTPHRGQATPRPERESEFARLDAGVPLLLLPVRIETVFDETSAPGRGDRQEREKEKPRPALLVRIYPDDIHADRHARGLLRGEIALGRRFWTMAWSPAGTRERLQQAFAQLATRLGAFRASWVLEATRPLDWDQRGGGKAGQPRFGEPPARNSAAPGRARLLPDRWIVTGYQGGEFLFRQEGSPIPNDLPITPDLAASGPAPKTIADLLSAQGLAWTSDFTAAEAAGMALRVELGDDFRPQERLDLFVVGARTAETPERASQRLADLLAAHHWTHGIDFVRRGTPTNNSDRASSGVSLSEPDVNALLDSVLARPDVRRDPGDPLPRRRFHSAASLALGLEPGSILERLALRDDAQLDLAAAMSAALWPATWGYFLRTMIAGAVDDTTIGWLRRHFITRVKGGGLLPAIRIGDQPYGLLPIAPEESREQPADTIDALENLLVALLPAWKEAAAERVARLDVNTPDSPGGAEPDPAELAGATATLARILGATPNPSDLMLSPVTNQLGLYQVRWVLFLFLLDLATSPRFPTIASRLGADLDAAKTLEAQIDVLESVIAQGGASGTPGALWSEAHSGANDEPTQQAAQEAIDYITAFMLPLLYNHRDRIEPVIDGGPDRTEITGVMADGDDPPLFFSLFGETETRIPWTGGLVARDTGEVDEVRGWLDALAVEVRDPAQPASAPGGHPPLLFQLLMRAIAVAHGDDRADLRAGLETLAAAAADGRLADPVADLEVLMGEVLGTCMHRLDAWLSAGAAERLELARRERPRGLAIGAYGWVLDLRPSSAAPSQGFIHAPSLDHAASAAILRSGWSALGDGALGIDVSSARARAAAWIVDGVRDGHHLGELFGQSLERRLHDGLLDRWIEPIRSAILEATGRGGEQPVAIVDGFVVARAWLGGNEVAPLTSEETAARGALLAVLKGAGTEETTLRGTLDVHAADLDAVADASLFESVHAIVRGNTDRAAATLAATGDTASAPAPLTALRTTRGGQRITHRIVMLLDAAKSVSHPLSPPAIAEPVLEAWVATVLPFDRIGFGAWLEENGTRSWQGPATLASVGIGALELLDEVPSGDVAGPGTSLARRLAWRIERDAARAGRTLTATIDAELTGGAGGTLLPLALALAAAHALRGLLHGGRALVDSDLATDTRESTVAAATLGSRTDNLIDAARDAATSLAVAIDGAAPTATVLDACVALAPWRIAGAVPRAGLADLASGTDTADRAALLDEARAILDRLRARLAAHDAVKGNDARASLARMRALLPGVVVLPPFTPSDGDMLRTAAARSASRLGSPEEAMPWLHQAGRVRETARAAAVAVDLVEAAMGATAFAPTLIQLPDHGDEGWAATSRPAHDTGPRTAILSLTPMPAGPTIAGLAIDGWTEVIPDTRADSGIAVHFDSPSARAPQAWLLATPPRDKAWTHDDVLALVRQTLDRAQARAVSPDEIEGYGQFLPTAYLDDATDPGPTRTGGRAT